MVFAKNKGSIKVDVIKVVNDIFDQAVEAGASDIHLEPSREGFIIRYRVDGIMRVVFEGDKTLYDFIVGRILDQLGFENELCPRWSGE